MALLDEGNTGQRDLMGLAELVKQLSNQEKRMFSLVMVGSNDIERSKRFYDALFVTIGAKPSSEDPQGRLVYQHNGSMFLVTPPIDGEPAVRHGPTVGFSVSGPDQAHAWHQAGIAAGGKAMDDPPGKRLVHGVNMFAAYLSDPDGNNLCALHNLDAD